MYIQRMGCVDFEVTNAAMQNFTAQRTAATADEIWLCEHQPVYSLGVASQYAHILQPGTTPIVQTQRGGQVTFHGPGQVVGYPLIDLRRAGYYVKEFVYRIEDAILRTLGHYAVVGHRVTGAPGIYVRIDDPFSHHMLANNPSPLTSTHKVPPNFSGLAKIAALGIKVSKHCTYHGLALNVSMDLSHFDRINPCGYAQLKTTDLATIGIQTSWDDAAQLLGRFLEVNLTP